MNRSVTTKRLTIRNFIDGDWPYVYEYTKLEHVMAFVNHGMMTLGETIRFVNENIGGKPLAFPIIITDTNQLIGHLTFTPYLSGHTYEIGWIIHPDFQGQGYASEAALAFIIHVFRYQKIHRIIARSSSENKPSIRVMEKIGLRKEAHFKMCLPYGEKEWHDELVYATLRSEWLEKLTYPFVATFKK